MPKEKFFKTIIFHVFFIVFIILSFYFLDHYFLDLSTSLISPINRFFTFLRNIQDGEIPITACIFLFIIVFFLNKHNILSKNKHLAMAKISLYTISAIAISGIIANIIKFTTGRPRPNFFIHTNMSGFQWFEFDSSLRSFPSAHTTTGISVIMVLLCFTTKNPLWRLLFLLVGSLLAISHTMVMVHWFSDVIVGSYIAVLTVLWLRSRYDYLYERFIYRVLDL